MCYSTAVPSSRFFDNAQHNSPLFLRLPVEILQQISSHLYHSDMESITLSCRKLYAVAFQHLLRHRERKRRLSRLIFGKTRSGEVFGHPAELLSEIFVDSTVALYPVKVTLEDCHVNHDLWSFNENRSQPRSSWDVIKPMEHLGHPPQGILEFSINHVLSTGLFRDWNSFTERISACHELPMIALLLSFFTNLQTVSLDKSFSRDCHFIEWISIMKEASQANPDLLYPLGRLERVEIIDPWYISHRIASDGLNPFVGLPSLRSFYVERVISGRNPQYTVRQTPPTSTIVELVLERCCFGAKYFATLVSRMPNLRDFRYRFGWTFYTTYFTPLGHSSSRWRPRFYVDILLKYASESLVSLELTAGCRQRISLKIGLYALARCGSSRFSSPLELT